MPPKDDDRPDDDDLKNKPPEGDPDETDEGDDDSPEKALEIAKAETKRARQEAAKFRKERSQLKSQLESLQDKVAELEKDPKDRGDGRTVPIDKYESLLSEHKAMKSRVKETAINSSLTSALSKSGCIDIDAAVRLVDHELIDYDDETSKVTGADLAAEILAKDRKYLFESARKPKAKGAAQGKFDGVQEMTREEIMDLPAGDKRRIDWFRKKREEKRKRGGF